MHVHQGPRSVCCRSHRFGILCSHAHVMNGCYYVPGTMVHELERLVHNPARHLPGTTASREGVGCLVYATLAAVDVRRR
jgi:hypothetical protein